jgi:hypothetical protein
MTCKLERAVTVAKLPMHSASRRARAIAIAHKSVQGARQKELAAIEAFRARWGGTAALLVRADGTMRITGQGLDIASRYLYPLAYAVFLTRLFNELPSEAQPYSSPVPFKCSEQLVNQTSNGSASASYSYSYDF